MTQETDGESALCTACGLCCTGALHDYALLDEDETEAAAEIGLPVVPSASTPRFSLPCPKLSGATCTIYRVRPRACAAYACRLLEDVRQGRPLGSALEVVAEGRRLAEAVRDTLELGENFTDSRVHAFEPNGRLANQLASIALSHYLDRHFCNRAEGPLLTSEPAK